jgi:hypothetical protein
MRKIVLYAAALLNGGNYIDAGATVEIGDGADQISADRAKELVDGGRAASVTAARADETATV